MRRTQFREKCFLVSRGNTASQVAHQRFLCALKAHFEYQNALLMRIKSAGVLPGLIGKYIDHSLVAQPKSSTFFDDNGTFVGHALNI